MTHDSDNPPPPLTEVLKEELLGDGLKIADRVEIAIHMRDLLVLPTRYTRGQSENGGMEVNFHITLATTEWSHRLLAQGHAHSQGHAP